MNDIEQNEQYFPVVPFIFLYKVVLTFDHSNQSLQRKCYNSFSNTVGVTFKFPFLLFSGHDDMLFTFVL